MKLRYYINPRTYKWVEVFASFLLEDKTSAPDVFSSCSFIPGAHFKSRSVFMVTRSEKWRHK